MFPLSRLQKQSNQCKLLLLTETLASASLAAASSAMARARESLFFKKEKSREERRRAKTNSEKTSKLSFFFRSRAERQKEKKKSDAARLHRRGGQGRRAFLLILSALRDLHRLSAHAQVSRTSLRRFSKEGTEQGKSRHSPVDRFQCLLFFKKHSVDAPAAPRAGHGDMHPPPGLSFSRGARGEFR